jgi:DNA-binding response OmpR family regulator
MAFDPSTLGGSRILIADDEWFPAAYISEAVASAGGVPLGPVPAVKAALEWLDTTAPDAVALNVRLRGECSFPVADKLVALRIPFVFVAEGSVIIPVRLVSIPLLVKPFAAHQMVAELSGLVKSRLTSGPMVRGH